MERSSSVDIRADIYSLGCTLYYLLSGQAPYGKSTSVIEQVMAHRKAPVPSIHEVRPDVPRELTGPLTRMLAKQPQDRYSTPHEVAEALAPFAPEGYRSSGSIPRLPGSGDFGQAAAAPLKRPRWQVIGGAAFAVFIAVLVLFWAFGSRGGMIPPLPSGPPIKVGILHSRTGTMATSEQPVIDATLFAIDEVNAAGGVLGRPVEALVEDGQSEPATFAQKAEKLISLDGVSAIFGCWTSASRKEVKKVVERHDHLLLYPVQNEGLEESPNIFYIGASPNQQITPAVRWCVTFLNKKRLFLVGSDYIFPRAANAIIRDQARALGAEVVGEEYLPMGATDAAPVARKIRSANPEVILNTINGDTNIAFFRALRAAGVLSTSIPTISFSITEVSLTSLSPKEMAGDYVAWNYFQSIDDPKNTDFLHRFRNRLGARDVSDPMETAYVAVRLWAQAVEAAGSEEVEKVRGPLLSQSFDAPEGLVRIDAATRRAIKFIRIGRMTEDGRCEIVYSSEVPIEPVPYPETRSRVEWETFLTDLQLSWGGQWVNPKR
jgi:urea transport system substrate-binding protein